MDMKNIIIFALLVLIILINACTSQNSQKELEDSHKKITEQQKEINSLKAEVTRLNEELTQFQPKELLYKVDLTQWDEDEIIKALALRNNKFKNTSWFQYQYRDDGSYYDLVGAIFPIDPFHKLAYSKRNRELKVNSLRIFNLDPALKEIGDDEFQKYQNEVNKQIQLNEEIKCVNQKECRGTTLIICKAKDSTLYTWYSYPYLFSARDDNGETFETFKEFYCEV